jgi:DnaJ family protein C protein 17
MKPPKKAPQKPPKTATALIPFTAVGAAFAAVSASNRTERGLDGIEVSWAGGSEPPLIGWLKKKGMLGASGGDAPKAPTPLPATTPGITSSSADNGDPFSSFPASVRYTLALILFLELCSLHLQLAADAKSPVAAASSNVDSESLLLMRMREAERARLEQEILEQEGGS